MIRHRYIDTEFFKIQDTIDTAEIFYLKNNFKLRIKTQIINYGLILRSKITDA